MGQLTNRDDEPYLPEGERVTNRGFSFAVRCAIVSLFISCLTLFVHFREVRIEVLELHTPSPRYIVAQVDFSFYDDQATVIMRQEAVRDVGKIYEITERSIQAARISLDKEIQNSEEWRQLVSTTTFDELDAGIDLLEKTLSGLRLTDPRTLKKQNELNLPTDNYLSYSPPNSSEDEQSLKLPENLWKKIQTLAFKESKLSEEAKNYLIGHLSTQPFTLIEDINSERALRLKIQSEVPKKFSKISAGNRIIDKGDDVTERHIEMLTRMNQVILEEHNLWSPVTLLGSFIIATVVTILAGAFLWNYQPQAILSNRLLLLLVTLNVMTLILAKSIDFAIFSNYSNLIYLFHYPLIIPFPAILMCILLSPSISALSSMFLAIVLSISLPIEKQGFLITNLATALLAIIGARHMERRTDIFLVCGRCWCVCALLIVANNFYDQTYDQMAMAIDLASTAFFMVLTGILSIGLLPLFESIFRIMTNLTLMEYMDPNHPLLRRLSIEAPGTYQHSIVVGNLAEAAAAAIGANGLYCRVAALFHDIGKIITPQYFTENQQSGIDIHQLLTPEESAQVIMDHVREGVELAKRAGLPYEFIQAIREHHGTTLVYYFYRKQLDLLKGDNSLVDMDRFRYRGPKPQTKEHAILMIADTLEAASRTLTEFSEAAITELLTKLVRHKEEDGQFDECSLTFKELATIMKTLIKALVASTHARIQYPEHPSHDIEEEIES